jgi:hypothetical protein
MEDDWKKERSREGGHEGITCMRGTMLDATLPSPIKDHQEHDLGEVPNAL